MTSEQTVVCARCGYPNAPGDQFCGSCGAFLEWGAAPAEATAAPGAPPVGASAMPAVPPAAPAPVPSAREALVRCPSCGIANPDSRTFCQACGAKLSVGAVVSARTRDEVAAAVAAVPGASPPPARRGAQGPGPATGGAVPGGRRLPGWIAAVVVLGVLVGVGAVAGSQLLNGGGVASDASAAPTPSGPMASTAPGGSPGASPSLASHPAASPTAAPVAGKQLKLTSASASSILGGNPGKYGPQNVIDGSLKTSWQEGAATEQGQWIEVGFAPATVTAILIRNGFQASSALYKGNERLRAVLISVDGGPPTAVTLKDTTAAQRISLAPVAKATRVRITIVSVYPAVKTSVSGSPFKDAALSEIGVLGVAGG